MKDFGYIFSFFAFSSNKVNSFSILNVLPYNSIDNIILQLHIDECYDSQLIIKQNCFEQWRSVVLLAISSFSSIFFLLRYP